MEKVVIAVFKACSAPNTQSLEVMIERHTSEDMSTMFYLFILEDGLPLDKQPMPSLEFAVAQASDYVLGRLTGQPG